MSDQYPKLLLPRGYLSWSQMDCWMKNRSRYIKEYFDAGEKLDTPYLRFGSKFSKMVEALSKLTESGVSREVAVAAVAKEFPMDENMQAVMMELDIEGISEYQIGNSGRKDDNYHVCKVRGIVPILAFLDKYILRNGAIQEYKTGMAEWTMAKVQKHDQLPFYGVGLKYSGRRLPEYADLHWIETKQTTQEATDFWREGDKIIYATGKIKTFHREFDEREFERMEDLIIRVAWEISDAYQEHLAQI